MENTIHYFILTIPPLIQSLSVETRKKATNIFQWKTRWEASKQLADFGAETRGLGLGLEDKKNRRPPIKGEANTHITITGPSQITHQSSSQTTHHIIRLDRTITGLGRSGNEGIEAAAIIGFVSLQPFFVFRFMFMMFMLINMLCLLHIIIMS